MFRADRGVKQLNLQERSSIISFTLYGGSIRRVALDTGFNRGTVRRWRMRFAETGDVLRQIGSGRPCVVTPIQDDMLVEAVSAKPITTAQELSGIFMIKSNI